MASILLPYLAMEYLRALLSGPGPAVAGLGGTPAPSGEPVAAATPFVEELFEEGARAGTPWFSPARQGAALDSQARRGMGDDLPVDRDRNELAQEDSAPESELSFGDFLDVINPLQHIPIVGNIYRNLTGDTISGPARVAGAALYGGPVGMLAGIVNAIAAEISGDDLGGTLIASIVGESPPDDTLVAEAPEAVAILEPAAKPASPVASFAAQPRTGLLTGDAALSALLGDLRAEPEFPMELTGLAPAFRAPAVTLPSRAEDRTPAQARPEKVGTAARGFSEQMMLGMDKYRALAIERGGAGRPALERVDRRF